MNPNMGRIFSSTTKRYSNVTGENVKSFVYTGETQKIGNLRCAVFKKEGDNTVYLQPWDNSNLRKPGENNISAKLNNNQVREIIRAVHLKTQDQVTFASLAEKYGVRSRTISDIAHGRAWRHITRSYINELKNGKREVKASCISASNKESKRHTKLSPSMAKFIVRDHMINKIPIASLAEKFIVSESTIRKVVTGKMYSEVTTPAINEYNKWNQK